MDAEAVIVPGIEHLGGQASNELLAVADTIIVDTQETFSRWIVPPDTPADLGSR
ncbi:hypothetical protein [Nocardia sp.]|uniref:hypothetical protein n=1 Tax=Nocardia sp. TaxID=1821 RepID=UPI002605EF7F|nr:hypothetical protein [Nocardia sp.]